jgi:anti-sigma factor RsiW
MNWNCTQVEERLSDFLDAQLSPEERAEFSAHMATCPDCTRLVERVGGILQQVHRLEMLEPPPQLIGHILDGTLGPRGREKSRRGWLAWFPAIWQPRFAIGAAVAALSLVITFHALGASPARLKHADLNPVDLVRLANRHAHLVYARSARFVNDLRVVYEIQTRLRPEAQPAQEQQPPSPAPTEQQKSQGAPHPGRSANRVTVVMAFALVSGPVRSMR